MLVIVRPETTTRQITTQTDKIARQHDMCL
jgi:hypothetical protein